MLKLNKKYFLPTFLLLIIEICIALFVHDKIVRPYIGDYLVVMLVYCFVRAFVNCSVRAAAIFTLLFAYLVELLQYFNVVQLLGLQRSGVAGTVIGSSFEWTDIALYTAGVATIVLIERRRTK